MDMKKLLAVLISVMLLCGMALTMDNYAETLSALIDSTSEECISEQA